MWTTPKTWAVGDPGTSPDLNTYLRDNSNFLYGDLAWTAVSAFSNSWVNYGAPYFAAAYRKVGTRVLLRGMIKSGVSGAVAFVLPAGYRPNGSNVDFICDANGNPGVALVDASGNVTPTTTNTGFFSLNQIAFDTL